MLLLSQSPGCFWTGTTEGRRSQARWGICEASCCGSAGGQTWTRSRPSRAQGTPFNTLCSPILCT